MHITWFARKLGSRGDNFSDFSPEAYVQLMGLARLLSTYLIQCSVAIEMMLSEQKEYSRVSRKHRARVSSK